MGRTSSNRPRNATRRARPALEGLEQRWVPSTAHGGLPIVPDSSPAGGEFFHNFQQFNYTTPQGTHVELQIVGRGSLQGTTVDSSGALHLLFSKTNSFSKIVSNVHGGTGQADLASIFSADLFNNNAESSLSGIGASVIKMINLGNFNLIAGGTIDVTSGIGNLNLNSVGPEHADPASRAPLHRHGRPDHQHHRCERHELVRHRRVPGPVAGRHQRRVPVGRQHRERHGSHQPGPAAGTSGDRPEDQPHQRQRRLGAEPVDRQQDLRLRPDRRGR